MERGETTTATTPTASQQGDAPVVVSQATNAAVASHVSTPLTKAVNVTNLLATQTTPTVATRLLPMQQPLKSTRVKSTRVKDRLISIG